jgi:hypothetical protein
MKKAYLSIIGFALVCRFNVSAQVKRDSLARTNYSLNSTATRDTGSYNPRKLKVDEIDFVSSYYWQNGDHSAVTGGIGTEHVTDLSNGLDLNLVWQGNNQNKNHLDVGFGFDYHTAASQAYVSATGASSTTGTRIYPSLDYTFESAKTGNTIGAGLYYSSEFNYQSLGTDLHFSIKTDHKNGEFSAKLQGYFDQVKLIYPSELDPNAVDETTNPADDGYGHGRHEQYGSSPRTTLSAALSYSQQINERLQIMFMGDVVGQTGYLGLPFHRVYFNNGKDTIEKLPSSRFKLPVGFRLNYFLGDNIIIRSYYRYYQDDWGIKSNTVGIEVPYKVTSFFSISPFYRFYQQTASKYFAPYEDHSPTDEYYTSNYEYAKFDSQFFGVGFRVAPPKGVFGWQGLHDLEIRYGHYLQTTDLESDVVSLGLTFK